MSRMVRRTAIATWTLMGIAAVAYAHALAPRWRFFVSFVGLFWVVILGWQLARLLDARRIGTVAGTLLGLAVWLTAVWHYRGAEQRWARHALHNAPTLRASLPPGTDPAQCPETHFDYFLGQYEFTLACPGRTVHADVWPETPTRWAVLLH